MKYEKLSKNALGCMYTATIIRNILYIALIGFVNYIWLVPKENAIGKMVSLVLVVYFGISMLIWPYFRYLRYRYRIDEECIDVKEGFLFVERNLVPIERLHKLETNRGPIDQLFHVAKVTVTTAGGEVTLRFIDEEKANLIAESLQKRINKIVREKGKSDGK